MTVLDCFKILILGCWLCVIAACGQNNLQDKSSLANQPSSETLVLNASISDLSLENFSNIKDIHNQINQLSTSSQISFRQKTCQKQKTLIQEQLDITLSTQDQNEQNSASVEDATMVLTAWHQIKQFCNQENTLMQKADTYIQNHELELDLFIISSTPDPPVDTTSIIPEITIDCAGVLGGNAVVDECGICNGPGPKLWYADTDGDGLGEKNDIVPSCTEQPAGYIENNDDMFVLNQKHIIYNSSQTDYLSIYTTDMDNDGDIDILLGYYIGDCSSYIKWYENDGNNNPSFTEQTLLEHEDHSSNDCYDYADGSTHIYGHGIGDVYATDLDSDGDIDVLSASSNNHKINWYENNGSQSFTTHQIPYKVTTAESIDAKDIDGDGYIDIIAGSADDFPANAVIWFKNNGQKIPTFNPKTNLPTSAGVEAIYVIDINGDQKNDIISASLYSGTTNWHKNEGGDPLQFSMIKMADNIGQIASVYAIDLDNDEDIDILSAFISAGKIEWYENNGGSNPTFTTHIITDTAKGAVSVYAIDLDNDKDIDILSASAHNDTIAWYENNGESDPTFTTHIITNTENGAWEVYSVDIDQDGDMDIVSSSLGGNTTIVWYENLLIH